MKKTGFAAFLLVAGLTLAVQPAVRSQESGARDIGLREETERGLVQLDVSVQGPEESIRGLSKGDFELIVMGRRIDEFLVDSVCYDPVTVASSTPEESETPATTPAAPVPVRPTITYLLYFDHSFLTQEGRIRSVQIARDMIGDLMGNGNRAMVVSSGRDVTTFADLTDDVDEVLAGLEAMENDTNQWWDPTARSEELQIAEVLDKLQRRGADEAASLAKLYQADESWRTEKGLRRLSMTLGRLADLPQPKAILYFSDRMRSKPGAHYLTYFNQTQIRRNNALTAIGTDNAMSGLTFQGVVDEANAHGARFYTIQAQGMTGYGNIEVKSMPTAAGPGAGTRHITDAENTMVSMAAETGGEAFLRGIGAKKIVKSIQDQMRCVYLVSFESEGLPRNSAVPVLVRVSRSDVKVHHRGQIFLQSGSKRLTSRLMAAFAAPDAISGEGRIRGAVIPTGYVDGKFTAMIQVGVEGSPLPGASWDIGLSVLSRGKVREDAAERVKVGASGTPVVLEAMISFAPGPFELVLVGHETQTDEILTTKIEGSWPEIDGDDPVTIGPIAMMQPASAVFVRDGEVKTTGAAAHREFLAPELPTAMISLVCWGQKEKQPFRVERQLVGSSAAEFPPMDLQPDEQRCAQIRDVIRAGTMTDGEFKYEVHVYRADAQIAEGSRDFVAFDGEDDGVEEAAQRDGS